MKRGIEKVFVFLSWIATLRGTPDWPELKEPRRPTSQPTGPTTGVSFSLIPKSTKQPNSAKSAVTIECYTPSRYLSDENHEAVMSFEIRIEGVDRLMTKLDELAKNPRPLLVGKTINKPHVVTCEFCEKEYTVTLPLKIERVEGIWGYGPGGTITVACPECGKENEYTWTDVVIDINVTQ